jgi:alkyldihydroxyacetonephosphate synthase
VDTLDVLTRRLPDGAVSTDAGLLRDRAIDSWALALLRRARGDDLAVPAAVVFPARTEEVATVLAWASEVHVAVIPRGGGSGVCGGAAMPGGAGTPGGAAAKTAAAGSVVLDLSRMNRITAVDPVSQVVTAEAGVRGDQLEEVLGAHGLTTGHYPQSIAVSTVGGWIAASSAGQASTGFGAIEDLLLGLTAVLPGGEILCCRPVPRSAAGPDLRRLLVGSEGTLAVVTEATLACRARPAGWEWLAFGFGSFPALAEGLREAGRAATGAAVIRGYDEADAQLSFGALGHASGCVALLGFPFGPGGRETLEARKQAAAAALRQAGSSGPLDAAYGEHWWQHRNDAVATYASIMGPERAFGPGVIVDTFEVAGLWSDVPRLYAGIRDALAAHAQAVLCHLSHVYPSGSSLYFTFLVSGADDQDAEPRYLAAWDDATRSCAAAGGTLTHHHGVGRLKAPFLAAELGQEGLDVLRKIKTALDPGQIMNPGVLLP